MFCWSRNRSNFTVETLRFLTVSQALEDIAVFVAFIRKRFKLEKNKLFVFGASYGGTLAALFRRKYPHLTDAAVAMSAPMKRDYENKDFLPSIGKKLKKTDIMCYKQIELGLRQATRLLENHICNKRELPLCNKIRENLGLCSSLKGMTPLERRLFFGTIAKDFTFLTEYNGLLNATVKNICDVIAHPNIAAWSPLDKLLAGDIVISKELFMSKVRSGECLPTKKQDICEYLSNVTIKHNAVATGKRQRLWQSCSELGSFPTSNGDSKQHPFGGVDVLPFSYFADFCYCAFGHPLTSPFIKQRIDAFTRTFGPSSLSIGTKIIYSIGEDDPRLQRELRSTEKLASKCSKHVDENRIFIAKGFRYFPHT
ncbi:unnamed protein product [Orchesella dallaii]|uniref:Serine protease K12H4.7 n=1 Tax=Orchesella dallaii TaxID=48710 RepID=A0ABP1QSA7_9HEXA